MMQADDITALIQRILSCAGERVSLHEPSFNANEWRYVKECLDTGWVSSVGKYVDRFEYDLANYTGAKHAIATVNGTAALHICYLLAGIQRGDEVLVPTLTFVATANALAYCGAVPHFLDADFALGLDADKIDQYLHENTELSARTTYNTHTKKPIRALCVMHTLGHPVDLDALEKLCEKYHLVLLEDAAEALGSYYKGTHVGHRGLLGALSFNGNKIITTGGGGAILTNDAVLAKKAKHLTTTAKLPHAWEFRHDQIAYNYRLPNINAALGCAQLETLTKRLSDKRLLMQNYRHYFAGIEGISLIQEPEYAKSNYWLNALLLVDSLDNLNARDALLQALNQNGIMSRPLWNLQHTLPMYRDCPRMPLPIAENIITRLIQIPSSPELITRKQQLKKQEGVA
jgi:perosamine synthetase